MYTYIIVDFGELGSSDLNDQIIKAFIDASYKSVVVTTNDKMEISLFRNKLAECKIALNKISWLLNMCSTTKLEDKTRSILQGVKYEMIPFKPEIYGKKSHFMSDPLTRDKMTKFIDEAIIGSTRRAN